ncbi:MAG: hypothetical protein WAU88_02810, partial [Candidatus Zixiibacteriota bacterium]
QVPMRHRMGDKNRLRVWILENGSPRPVPIEKGIQNTSHIAIVDSPLKEGDSVIVASNGATSSTSQTGTNPFMPRFPGGGGGRPGGR